MSQQNGGTLEGVKKFLIMPTEGKRQTIHQQTDTDQQYPLFAFFMMSPAVSVACIAKEFSAAFWEIWGEICGQIPENPHLYTLEPCPPVEPFPTHRFLDVNPDDMAYYWTLDSGLPFSDEFREQAAEWRSELDTITERIAPQDFLKTLVDNISIGGSIFFREAFYEFISRQSEPKIQSVVLLMGHLAQREDKNLKRFHAILAIPLLRRDVFEF